MGRGKGKSRKGTRTKVIKSKAPKVDASGEIRIPPNMKPVIDNLKEVFERRVKLAEMKSIQQNQKLFSAIEDIRANQIVLQTLLVEGNLLNRDRFKEEYRNYLINVSGVVKDGQMDGIVLIDTFNIGKTPGPNSLTRIRDKSKNPIIIRG